jgi:hypothetical protein
MFLGFLFGKNTFLRIKLINNLIILTVKLILVQKPLLVNVLTGSVNCFAISAKRVLFLSKFYLTTFLGLKRISLVVFSVGFPAFRLIKAYGINMRVLRLYKRRKQNFLFLRLGFSHGFCVKLPKLHFFRVFKRRYFLISGVNLEWFDSLIYNLRYLRSFFEYKLIGLKLNRDKFKVKVGKKKTI